MSIWLLARGTGLAALVLLTATTCLGVISSGRGRVTTRVTTQYAHRVLASIALAALALHLGTILADAYAHVGWVGALVPFTSDYRPTWIAMGSLAAYLTLIVALSGAARRGFASSARGVTVWRRLHLLSYGGCALALLHGFFSGTDSSVVWVRGVYVVCLAAFATAVTLRIVRRHRPDLVRSPAADRPVLAGTR